MLIFRRFSFFVVFTVFLGVFSQDVFADSQEISKTFVVSAYYSPLPNQEKYVRGNFEAEKRLQGHGIRGADYTKVYVGMMAAPKTYAFGTKIFIPGLGTGTVHDRGGAIRGYDGFDRIDVWMGYGDDGRKRALEWGMRKVDGKIMPKDTPESLNFSVLSREEAMVAGATSLFEKKPSLFLGREGESVSELQTILQTLGFYNEKITGIFDIPTKNAVIAFQLDNDVLSNKTDYGAGVYGPMTQRKLFDLGTTVLALEKTEEEGETKKEEDSNAILAMGAKGNRVKDLQNFLSREGYFEGVATGYFGPRTEKALQEFQKSYDITAESELGKYGMLTQNQVKKLWNTSDTSQDFELGFAIVPSKIGLGDKGKDVKRLQIILRGLGYFDEEPTGTFGYKTQKAILAFQKEKKIISSTTDFGAGYFGPKTHRIFLKSLQEQRKNINTEVNFKTKEISEKKLAEIRKLHNEKKYAYEEMEVSLSAL